VEVVRADVVIVGGGCAGLRAALAAARSNARSVLCVSKVEPLRSASGTATAGAAAVARSDDEAQLHVRDTLAASEFLADPEAVEILAAEAPRELDQLARWGCPWTRDADGRVSVRAAGAMARARTWFAADRSGLHVLQTLFHTALGVETIGWLNEYLATKLLVSDGRACGVAALNLRTGSIKAVLGRAVVLATGGAGRMYAFTTNAGPQTGDGMSLAYRAGVPLADIEFVQFHPTALVPSGILLSEALRSAGASVHNARGERVLGDGGADSTEELARGDRAARSLESEIREGRAFSGPDGPYLGLDLSALGEQRLEHDFAGVSRLARCQLGRGALEAALPVRPAAHYMMGGVQVDTASATPLPGLFAAGETACVSVHGAHRLAGNALSECVVYGRRAGESAARFAAGVGEASAAPLIDQASAEESRIERLLGRRTGESSVAIGRALRRTMGEHCGVFRESRGLLAASREISQLKARYANVMLGDRSRTFNTELRAALELGHLLDVAEAVAFAARERRESRGAHARVDALREPETAPLHSRVRYSPAGPRLEQAPVGAAGRRAPEAGA
jgi:succinate dehydrogenase/fumarate reductase flavoprotein subunit